MKWCLSLVSYSILCVNLLYKNIQASRKVRIFSQMTLSWLKVKLANYAQTAKQLILIFLHFSSAVKFANKTYRLKQRKVKQVGLG